MFRKKGVLKNLANFTGKHLCWSLFLTKFLTNFIKKTLQHSCFPVKFAKFLRAPFSTEHIRWLLLYLSNPPTNQAINLVVRQRLITTLYVKGSQFKPSCGHLKSHFDMGQFAAYFQNTSSKNTSGRLLLLLFVVKILKIFHHRDVKLEEMGFCSLYS